MKYKEAVEKSEALEILINEAEKMASWMGHTLTWERFGFDYAIGTCVKCGLWVQCLPDLPTPYHSDIYGKAIALDCLG